MRIHRQYQGKLHPEDVVQDVWWRAMDSFSSYDPDKGNFRTWLFSIATNSLLDGFRRMRVRGEFADAGRDKRHTNAPQELIAQVTSICASARNNESVRGIIDSVKALDQEERSLFVHCALEGLTARVAAELIGISEDEAAERWQRLRTRLRESSVWQDFLAVQ